MEVRYVFRCHGCDENVIERTDVNPNYAGLSISEVAEKLFMERSARSTPLHLCTSADGYAEIAATALRSVRVGEKPPSDAIASNRR